MSRTKTKIIGLTGGIATGKSTVTQYLRKKKHPVICADELAHAVVKPKSKAYQQILKTFGPQILNKDHTLNRPKLAALVFNNPTLRKKLESFVHPQVRKELLAAIAKHKKNKAPLIFLDIPLLFENKLDQLCDHTICVTSFKKRQLERLKKERQMSRAQALARIQAQMPLKDKVLKANFVIKNNSDKRALYKAVDQVIECL